MENTDQSTRILVGADEAGYGPNLGPLLIAISVWRIPNAMTTDQFDAALNGILRPEPWHNQCPHVPVGDSKQLYKSGSGLTTLEAGLLSVLSQTRPVAANLYELLSDVSSSADVFEQWVKTRAAPWYSGLEEVPVPVCHPVEEITRLAGLTSDLLNNNHIEFLGARARVITEYAFNRSLEKLGSKGQLLSTQTLDLVSETLQVYDEPIEVFCDRQGGRTNYLPVLCEAISDQWFVELRRTTESISYRNTKHPRIEMHFTIKGDRFIPTSVASMLAKYLRERFMGAFNQYWSRWVPGILPTAGYPVDAKRFRSAILEAARENNLPDLLWWRCK